MNFEIPKSKYEIILEWIINTLKSNSFLDGIHIYDADYFIDESTKIPAIAIQKGELKEETDPSEKCIGSHAVATTVTISLHIPPASNNVDPVLHYFEETVISQFNDALVIGEEPNPVNYFKFSSSKITNLYKIQDNSIFSNLCKITFNLGYSI